MLTYHNINYRKDAGQMCDASLGNMLFKIASVIGIATMNGYAYGFPEWVNQKFFKDHLPRFDGPLKTFKMRENFRGFDFGFPGVQVPDNRALCGEMGDWKYFEHCEGLIRRYFEMREICEPYKDCILVHVRDYGGNKDWFPLSDYYKKALKRLPKKPVIVVTDNIEVAYERTKLLADYTSNSPIVDFYLLCNADYLVTANSTFSLWGAFLSGAETVVPKDWFQGNFKDAPTEHLRRKEWIVI
jgi:hypothetical protein